MADLEPELRRVDGLSVQRSVDEGLLALLVHDGRDEQCLVEIERTTAALAIHGTRTIVIRTPAGSVDARARLATRWNACVVEPSESVIATIRAISDPLTVCGVTCFDIMDLLSLATPPCYGGRRVQRARGALLTIHAPPEISLAEISTIYDGATSAYPDVPLLLATPTSNALTISLIVLADA